MPNKSINLVPQGKKLSPQASKTANRLKKISLVGYIIFVLIVAGLAASLYVLDGKSKEVISKQEDLKSQIKALEETEKDFYLIKDRLSKIETILGNENAHAEIDALIKTQEIATPYAILSAANIEDDFADIELILPAAVNVSELLDKLVDSGNYGRIRINNLSYTSNTGYLLELRIIPKEESS